MAYYALCKARLSFQLVRANEIKKGGLEGRPFLFVPGGWASNKLASLGEEGKKAIMDFIRKGGRYFGICGGAGLATQEGLNLVSIKRKSSTDRIPSFSGKINLKLYPHPLWEGIKKPYSFYAWYPSQLSTDRGVIARFLKPDPFSFTSDVCIGDYHGADFFDWGGWEKNYGINLDPKRLYMEPAVVEEEYENGKILLSLVHLDTPFDSKGLMVLTNVWKYLNGQVGDHVYLSKRDFNYNRKTKKLYRMAKDLFEFGRRNFLWYWRNHFLLMWRRGIRGLEYSTLYVLLREIYMKVDEKELEYFGFQRFKVLEEMVEEFMSKSKKLLIMERELLSKGPISWKNTENHAANLLREELFGTQKHHGGLFRKIAKELEDLLYITYTGHLEKRHHS
ncbi:MAG: BPL-N domain-containing protein [Deltaproteobacteria bacterium]|nr:BPL-N domain-containing protein [Deltaproteobacteria bacterium]